MNRPYKTTEDKARPGKWLWVARFCKTRAIARQTIDGGKVRCEGIRARPDNVAEIGMKIRLPQGNRERTVIVAGVRNDHRPGPGSTTALPRNRGRHPPERGVGRHASPSPNAVASASYPTLKQRREIRKFREI